MTGAQPAFNVLESTCKGLSQSNNELAFESFMIIHNQPSAPASKQEDTDLGDADVCSRDCKFVFKIMQKNYLQENNFGARYEKKEK